MHPVCSECDVTGERLGLCGNYSGVENVTWCTSSGRLKISCTKCRLFIRLKLSWFRSTRSWFHCICSV